MKTTPVKLACALMASAMLLAGCICPGNNSVIFPDRALESTVRAALGMPFGCLSQTELASITELQGTGLGIQSLEGLEFCQNLITLNVSTNSIDSISPLANLSNLTFVDVSDNDITDISPLAGLFYLQTLVLDGNPRILDWTALEANVNNGGFPEGGTVVVGAESVQAEDGSTLPSFQRAEAALVAAGVNVIITTASAS